MGTSRAHPPVAGGRTWRPILDDALAERALAEVDAIARELIRIDAARVDWSLAGGHAGLAIFFHYLARARPDSRLTEAVDRHLAAAIDAVAETSMSASLFGGFVGVGWAVEHLAAAQGGAGDVNDDLDRVLFEILDCPRWTGHYDLAFGLTGFALYALERLPHPDALRTLRQILAHLESTARREPDGLTWFTPPELLLPLVDDAPHGFYNLGVAHGIPGVLSLLGRMSAAGVDPVRARHLLGAAAPWLLARRLPGSPGAQFPVCIEEGATPAPARSAWCYGDPGIAAALLVAADGAADPDLRAQATALALGAARRPPAECGVVGSGLCHGAAGLGHLFNRLYQSIGDPSLRAAARHWLSRALDEPRPTLDGWPSAATSWQSPAGLLEGSAGVALALLAAATDVPPDWDRFLLISG